MGHSDEDVEKVVSFLKAQGQPEYVEEVTQEAEELPPDMMAEGEGSLYDKLLPLSRATGAPRPAMCKGACKSAITAPPA